VGSPPRGPKEGRAVLRLRHVADRVFIPRPFKRIYVEASHGVPSLQGSHIAYFDPADIKYL